jgi:hypothetical protein
MAAIFDFVLAAAAEVRDRKTTSTAALQRG